MDMGGAKLKAVKKMSKEDKKVPMTQLWVVGGIVAAMSVIIAIVTW